MGVPVACITVPDIAVMGSAVTHVVRAVADSEKRENHLHDSQHSGWHSHKPEYLLKRGNRTPPILHFSSPFLR
jgi:hypothetical protein